MAMADAELHWVVRLHVYKWCLGHWKQWASSQGIAIVEGFINYLSGTWRQTGNLMRRYREVKTLMKAL